MSAAFRAAVGPRKGDGSRRRTAAAAAVSEKEFLSTEVRRSERLADAASARAEVERNALVRCWPEALGEVR